MPAAADPPPPPAAAADAPAVSAKDQAILTCTTKGSRLATYSLIGGQHLCNYVTRFAIPYIVPHMVREFGFTDLQVGTAHPPGCSALLIAKRIAYRPRQPT